MDIHQKLRLQSISRWGMVNTSRPQSVAEHSYNVALIAEEIAKRAYHGEPGSLFAAVPQLYAMAIRHDLMEVLTGDVPAPTKLGVIAHSPEGINVWDDTLKALDADQLEECRSGNPELRAIMKAADFIEAILYLHLYAVGKHARGVIGWLRIKFESFIEHNKKKYKNIDWTEIPALLEEILENA